MRNWIDSKTYDLMIKASLGVSLPVVIVTAVMFFIGEPITSFERKTLFMCPSRCCINCVSGC